MSAATRTVTTGEPARTLRTMDLLILSIGTFTLGVDGFVLSGLLPQVASSLHVSVSTVGPAFAAAGRVLAAGSSVALVAGLPFGVLVGQTWGWRAAMWALVVLAALSTAAVRFLPAAHALKLGLRRRAGALTDRRVLAVLAVTRTVDIAAVVTMSVLGLAVGLAVVPQQVRLFATVPKLAPIAVGLNGSVIYTGSALGAAVGGLTLATAGPAAPAIAAAAIGLLGVIVAATVVPERIRASRHESTSC